MQLIKKVLIKQVITEKSKQKLYDNFQQEKIRLERECEQLLFEQRKLMNKQKNSKQEIEKRFQEEIKKRRDNIHVLNFKLEQLALLDDGSEIIEAEAEAMIDVQVGSIWSNIQKPSSIIIKDDVVVRIDND